jgi:RNA polymerase sigma factor (sigma-70 family)
MLSKPMSGTDREELFAAINSILTDMPAPLQEVFELSHYRGLSLAEIARLTGNSEEAASRLLAEANNHLFRRLWPQARTVAVAV